MRPQADLTTIPDGIQEYLKKMNDTRLDSRKPNHYWVTDICKCLRQKYYEITGTQADTDIKLDIEHLWLLESKVPP